MFPFILKLLRLCRPFKQRLVLGLLTGVLAGLLEPVFNVSVALVMDVMFPTAGAQFVGGSAQKYLDRIEHLLPDSVHSEKGGIKIVLIMIIPLVMLLRNLMTYLNLYFLQWVSVRAITDLRTRIFSHLTNMPLAFLSKLSTGEIISRIGSDTGALQGTISNSLVSLIKDPMTVLSVAAVLLYREPKLTLFSLIVFPVCLVPITIYNRKIRKSAAAIQTQYAEISKIMHESFTSNRIVKAYNLEGMVLEQFRRASSTFVGHYMRIVRAMEIPGPLIEVFGAVGVSFIFYYIIFLSGRTMAIGDFVFFVVSIFSLYRPIKMISRLNSQLEQAKASSARVFELLETPNAMVESASPKPLKAAGAEIIFDAIDFSYDSKPVLKNFNLVIQPGQMVALVGHTGSGKTTVTNLLLRFYDPQSGGIRIGGTDIRDVSISDLRGQIAVVTQDVLLFDETIRRNIELGRPGASEADIIAAAKHARAHEFILEKEEGYRTKVGEKGVTLSGGQKQRLSIARAILKNAPILILDEATSSLDTEVERQIQGALDDLMENRTTICIAHRLNTIQRADVIVVMKEGRIVEMGRHEELLAQDGLYRKLHQLQFKLDT